MLQSIKELIAVLVLTAPIWFYAGRLFASFCSPEDFKRRRNLWFCLTIIGLLAPSIWIYAALAIPLIYTAARKDSNPVALYILLCFVVPNVSIPLPSIVVNELFDISHQRLLAFFLIVPALLRARRQNHGFGTDRAIRVHRLESMDRFLLAYIALSILLMVPYDSVTHTLRRTMLAVLDIWLLFYFWSRLTPRYEIMREILAFWVLAAMLMSIPAVFEAARDWLLYAPIASRWGNPNEFAFLLRGGALRAQVSTGHSLTLGIWLATAWALFLFIHTAWTSKLVKAAVALVLLAGLGASMARGAWIAALASTVIYFLLNPKGVTSAIKGLAGFTVLFCLFILTPLGERFLELLPFFGTEETGNVEYRKLLFEVSVGLIMENPWFGDPFVMRHMEMLRQGQGIIDLVNGYLVIALFNGLVGLAIFLCFLLSGVRRGYVAWRRFRRSNHEMALLGASLLAAILGTMLFIATAGIDPMTYMLCGLLSSYWWIAIGTKTSLSKGIPTGGGLSRSAIDVQR